MTELAARAGVAQSVISAYEAGRREPSLPMLAKLVEATGHRMRIHLLPVPDTSAACPTLRSADACASIGERHSRSLRRAARTT